MKRMMTLVLALVMLFAVSACTRTTTPATDPTDAPVDETVMPDAEPSVVPDMDADATVLTPAENLTAADVLAMIADYHEETVGSMMQQYAAAATVLNFCKAGGPAKDSFADDVKAYVDGLDADARAAFTAQFDAVVDLAQRIAKGDVTQEEVEGILTDSDVTYDPVDPLEFEHDQLTAFADAVHAATQA